MSRLAATARARGLSLLWPVDRIVVGYCGLMVLLLLVFGRPLAAYLDDLAFYVAMGTFSIVIASTLDATSGGWRAFVRLLYPAIMFTFFYRATGGTMHLLWPEFFDAHVVAFEKQILGFHPTLLFDRTALSPWLNEILLFCYSSYYLMLPAFLLPAFLRRDYGVIRSFTAAASIAFFVSYLIFFLYPVEGPRWHFSAEYVNDIQGPLFVQLVHYVMAKAAVHGGAMPSSHTSVAIVLLLFCYRHYRRIAHYVTPIVTGLALGAVWGRFHYLSDILVGVLIGVLTTVAVWRYLDRGESVAREAETLSRQRTEAI